MFIDEHTFSIPVNDDITGPVVYQYRDIEKL